MGPLSQILEMLPGGMGQMTRQMDPKDAEKQMKLTEAIINSMTRQERKDPDVLNASRRRRIARGSGTDVQNVNRLMKQFRDAQRMMKTLQKSGGRGLPRLFG
jgi:signal recognition particle subunit SRP54